jgi:colanic acid biosynthesis glycosyl transferase WcaI
VRIIINDFLGLAPQAQLSRALASRGHDVLHLYSTDAQTPKADLTRRPDDPPSFAIRGLALGSPPAKSFLGKRLQEAKYGRIIAKAALEFRPDVVVGCNNPLDVQRRIQSACSRAGIRFVYWMQEFYALKIDRIIENRNAVINIAVGSYYHALERKLLQRSDAVVPLAEDHLAILAESWDVSTRQCMVVHNWYPLDRLRPGNKSNAWSRRVGVADKPVALYAGTLGPMEHPALLVEIAEKLRGRSDVEILVVSEGPGADLVAADAKTRGLENLRVLPFEPYEGYADILASADVLLAMVDDRAGVLYVPSKVTSYFCAGRPIVLSAPWQNIAAASIRESKAGMVTPPGDAAAMVEAILGYLNNQTRRTQTGEHARNYAQQTFDISAITDRFERLFQRLASGPPRRS